MENLIDFLNFTGIAAAVFVFMMAVIVFVVESTTRICSPNYKKLAQESEQEIAEENLAR